MFVVIKNIMLLRIIACMLKLVIMIPQYVKKIIIYSGVFASFTCSALTIEKGTSLDGLFSHSQSERGRHIFASHCAQCHAASQISGFINERWQGQNLGVFIDRINKTMPPESPGRLRAQDYLDIAANIFLTNGVAAGTDTLKIKSSDWKGVNIPKLLSGNISAAFEWSSENWTAYRGDTLSQGYSPADEINAENVNSLKVAWRWSGRNMGPSPEIKNITTPLMIDGVVYFTAGLTRNVIAVDAISGETLWMWRPNEGKRFETAPRKGAGRGVSYWKGDNGKGRIFTVTPGFHLVALDVSTGQPIEAFGKKGVIDLRQGLRLGENPILDIGSSSPPLVIGDVVVVGPAHSAGTRPKSKHNVKGDVRAYSVLTGELLWTFNTIPRSVTPGGGDWGNDANSYTGNAGVWAPMSADPDLNLIYLPVESPTNDFYGGARPGSNVFANSLVCLNAKTGEMLWHFQITHHDIWDWDLPAAPILIDIPAKKGVIKAVAQITKQALVYVFNRETGEPLWPIDEHPVPQSDVPGEKTSPTQPYPTKPLAFDRQGITNHELIDFTPDIYQKALEMIKRYKLGGPYAVAKLANATDGSMGTLTLPGPLGGANWEGGVVDPETGLLYVGSMSLPSILALEPSPPSSDTGYHGLIAFPTVEGLPLIKPPWGRITAIDLKTGEHVWMKPNGNAHEDIKRHPLLRGIDIGKTGKQTRSGLLVTKTLLFGGEGFTGSPVLRAYNKSNGETIAEISLPGTQTGLPMSYVWKGHQYIVMTVSDGNNPAELVALSLHNQQ